MQATGKQLAKFLLENRDVLGIDAIAVRGVSGAIIGGVLSYLTGLPLVLVRKTAGEGSHSGHEVESSDYIEDNFRYCIVDEFIHTGATLQEIERKVKEQFEGGVLGAILLYHSGSYSKQYASPVSGLTVPVYQWCDGAEKDMTITEKPSFFVKPQDEHLFLYAQGKYGYNKGNQVEELRMLISKKQSIGLSYVLDSMVVSNLQKIVQDIFTFYPDDKGKFLGLSKSLDVTDNCLAVMASVPTSHLREIDKGLLTTFEKRRKLLDKTSST